MSGDDDETIPLAKYPTFSWITDAYINWLTQQAVNMPTQIVSAGISTIGQLASGNVVGGLTTVAGTMANTMGQFYKASLLPNTTNGQNTADVNFAAERNTITFRCMRARKENIEIIDNYFSRFGYKVNEMKVPNFTGRTNWNYIEIGSNEILAYNSINNEFKDKINQIARRGVTIWHEHSNVGNFALANTIVT